MIAPWAPGWAVVIHRGRKSGRVFRTPLWAFRRGNSYIIALTYGPGADWVRNVTAAGGCELESGGRRYRLANPHVYRDDRAAEMPAFIRFMLRRVIKAPDFCGSRWRKNCQEQLTSDVGGCRHHDGAGQIRRHELVEEGGNGIQTKQQLHGPGNPAGGRTLRADRFHRR